MRGNQLPDFRKSDIRWTGGHALDRALERGKPPEEIERVIRETSGARERQDGRYELRSCIGGAVTVVVVAKTADGVIVPVTVFGKGTPCN